MLIILIFFCQNILALEAEKIINQDVVDQVKGYYPDLKREESLPLGSIQHQWDHADSNKSVYVVRFHPYETIKIRTREYMNSIIVLPIWDSIENISVGDPNVVKAKKKSNHLVLLEPQQFVGSDTNLIVTGSSGLIYNFYIRNEGYNSRHIPDLVIYVKSAKPISYLEESSSSNKKESNFDRLNFNFSMSGDQPIAPTLVYSDGRKIWLYYKDAPKNYPLVISLENGYEIPVKSYRSENHIIVFMNNNEIFPIVLKHGNKLTCIKKTKK